MRAMSTVFLIVAFLFILMTGSSPAAAREIPVYPGAKLVTEWEPDSEPLCCEFVTTAAFDTVVAFYEKALKTKGLEPRAFGAKYPDLKLNAEQLRRQMPPIVKIRIFSLREHLVRGTTGVETFDIMGSPAGVRFTVFEEQLSARDRHFADEYARAAGAPSAGRAPGSAGPDLLTAALPKRPPAGFTVGETVAGSGEGGGTFAQVSYEQQVRASTGRGPDDAAESVSIDVQISDVSDYPREEKQRLIAPEEDGRKVKVKGAYPGKERSGKSGSECSGSEVVFLVNDRYQVEVRSSGSCDLPLFYKLIDTMDLARLPK